MTQKSRRAFIRQCGTAAAVTAGWPAVLRAAKARDPIRYGVIGCGGRGRLFFEGAAYVCDPDRERPFRLWV